MDVIWSINQVKRGMKLLSHFNNYVTKISFYIKNELPKAIKYFYILCTTVEIYGQKYKFFICYFFLI